MPRRHVFFAILNVLTLTSLATALRLGWQPDGLTSFTVLVAFISADVVLWWSLERLHSARQERDERVD